MMVLLGCCVAPSAQGAPPERTYTRYDQDVILSADGTAKVTMTVDLDFSSQEGHGPIFSLVTRTRLKDPPWTYREIVYSDFTVTSPTGADVSLQVSGNDSDTTYRIGSEAKTYRDTQEYVVTYTVRGLVDRAASGSGLDEFNWIGFGTASDMVIQHPTVTLTGPTGVTRAVCFTGAGSEDVWDPCHAEHTSSTAKYTWDRLDLYQGMRVVAGFPAGTFTGEDEPALLESHAYFTAVDQQIALDRHGLAKVRMQFDVDTTRPTEEVLLGLDERRAIGDQRYRILTFSEFNLTSPTGADTAMKVTDSTASLIDHSRNVNGLFGPTTTVSFGESGPAGGPVTTYVLTFTVAGLVTQSMNNGSDLVRWDPSSLVDAKILSAPTVTIIGPDGVRPISCAVMEDRSTLDQSCLIGDDAVFSLADAYSAARLTSEVTTSFPSGTFTDVEVAIEDQSYMRAVGRSLMPNTGNAAGAAGILGVVVGVVAWLRRKFGRDEVFLGVAPGSTPAGGEVTATGAESASASISGRVEPGVALRASIGTRPQSALSRWKVPVCFAPPERMSVGMAAVLQARAPSTSQAPDEVIGATLVDLGVKGYLAIESTDDGGVRLRRTDKSTLQTLSVFEQAVLSSVFFNSVSTFAEVVEVEDLSRVYRRKRLANAVDDLVTLVRDERGWVVKTPDPLRGLLTTVAWSLMFAGVVLFFYLVKAQLSWIGLACALAGVVMMVFRPPTARLSALGSAELAQVLGFRQYIATAEADQLRWEEGHDIFSEYLPWAMIFGLTERWVQVFSTLAEQGRYTSSEKWLFSGDWAAVRRFASAGGSGGLGSLSTQASTSSYASQSGGGGYSGSSGFGGGGGGFGGGGSSSW
jgi:uncharacterized membrane protein YgcG